MAVFIMVTALVPCVFVIAVGLGRIALSFTARTCTVVQEVENA